MAQLSTDSFQTKNSTTLLSPKSFSNEQQTLVNKRNLNKDQEQTF